MSKLSLFARGAALSTLLALSAGPALAQGKADRARTAIAAAEAKVEVAAKLGADGDVPRLQSDAQAALRTAKEDLAAGRKEKAIATANEATRLADQAIGVSQQRQADAGAAQTQAAQDSAAMAESNAAAAAAAQQDAAAANARAAAAQQAASAASADAAAARAAMPAETTVTTETTKAAASPRRTTTKRVVRKPAARASAATTERTTTTVSTQN